MKHSCLWSSLALFAVLLCIASSNEQQETTYKVNEAGSRQVDRKYCGNQITSLYYSLCVTENRKRRSMFLDEKEALSFLQQQIHHRQRRSSSSGSSSSSSTTNVVEECCQEGCAHEEMYEYC